MKFRFTAEQLTKMGFGPLGKSSKIASELNALLEAEEVKCERVYFTRWSGNTIGKLCTVRQLDSTESALLWGVSSLPSVAAGSDRDAAIKAATEEFLEKNAGLMKKLRDQGD